MMRCFQILAILTLMPPLVLAKAGPEIPLPKVSLIDAVRQVETYFIDTFESKPRDEDFERFKKECIVIRAVYSNKYSDGG